MEKELFSFTNPAVVEAEKVITKVAIEAGFPCIRTV